MNADATPRSTDEILQERKRRIFTPRTLVFLALSLSLAWFLLRQIDFSRAADMAKNADLRIVGACVLTYLTAIFF